MIRGSETAIGRRAMWRRCSPPSTTASSDVRTRSPTRSLCSALAVSRWRVALAIWLKVVLVLYRRPERIQVRGGVDGCDRGDDRGARCGGECRRRGGRGGGLLTGSESMLCWVPQPLTPITVSEPKQPPLRVREPRPAQQLGWQHRRQPLAALRIRTLVLVDQRD